MKTILRELTVFIMLIFCSPSCNNHGYRNGNPGVQVFVTQANSGGPVNINSSAFPPNMFLDAFNKPVSGDVHIQYQEIYSQAPHTFASIGRADSTMLVPDEEFYIRATATHNNSPLHLARGSDYKPVNTFITYPEQ